MAHHMKLNPGESDKKNKESCYTSERKKKIFIWKKKMSSFSKMTKSKKYFYDGCDEIIHKKKNFSSTL